MSFELTAKCIKCNDLYDLDLSDEFCCENCHTNVMTEKDLKEKIIEAIEESAKENDEWKTPEIIISQQEFEQIEKGTLKISACYHIICEHTSESEKKMFMLGVKYGIRNALFNIADNFDVTDEWDAIVSKHL
jgi:Zn finger protein HypA/HybF involved in hydrogenase expression